MKLKKINLEAIAAGLDSTSKENIVELHKLILELKNYYHTKNLNISDSELFRHFEKIITMQSLIDLSSIKSSFKKFYVKDINLREKIVNMYDFRDSHISNKYLSNLSRLLFYFNKIYREFFKTTAEKILRTEYSFEKNSNFIFCMKTLDSLGESINKLRESSLDKDFQKKILRMLKKDYISGINNSKIKEDKKAFDLLIKAIKEKIVFYFSSISNKGETI